MTEKEYNQLISFIENNEKEKLYSILFEIKKRGDING